MSTWGRELRALGQLYFSSCLVPYIFLVLSAAVIQILTAMFWFCSLSPYSFDNSHSPTTLDSGQQVHNSVPLGALPLFAISSPDYQEHVSRVIMNANQVYHEFLKSNDGNGFNGQVLYLQLDFFLKM